VRLPDSVLFVGAHCDDVELMAGGLLARAAREGRRVGVLVFSDHRGVLDDAAAARARRELAANLAWLREGGADLEEHEPELWLPACRGRFEAEREALYAAMERLRDRYALVVTHGAHDTNQDHRQVAEEAARVFKAHATLLAGEHPHNDLGTFEPRVYLELAPADLDAKVRMVGAYASQRVGDRPYLEESTLRALARLRGSQIRAAAAEAFAVGARLLVPA